VEDLVAEERVDKQEAGYNGQQHQEELRIGQQHEGGRAAHLTHGDEGDEEVILDAVAHRLDVRDHAADQAPVAPGVEKGERLREQVGHQPVAEVAEDAFANLVGEADPPVEGDVGDQKAGCE